MRAWIESRLPIVAGLGLALALPLGGMAAEDGDFTAEKPKAPEAGAQAVNGLEMKLVVKERGFRMGGGDNAQERKFKMLTLEIKNVGDKPLVLDFQLGGGGFGGRGGRGGGAEEGPVKFFAKDAAGKELPRPEARPAPEGEAQPKPEELPAHLTVLKPGQTLEQPVMGGIRFPNAGKYTVWAELDVPAKDEVLPGIKAWSGKIKCAELEYDYQGFGGGRGGRGGRQGGQNAPQAPAPVPAEKEAF